MTKMMFNNVFVKIFSFIKLLFKNKSWLITINEKAIVLKIFKILGQIKF